MADTDSDKADQDFNPETDEAVDLEALSAVSPQSEPAQADGEMSQSVDADAAEDFTEAPPQKPAGDREKKNKELAQESAGLRENLEAQKDKYLRLMAEFDNYKRRTGKEYERMIEQAGERLMTDIIDVRDNLDRALAAARGGTDYKALLTGMDMIDEKLTSVLSKHGLSSFTEPGEEFNPELHDALMKQPHADIAEDHVVQVFEKGYKLKGKVIKHAKVVVSAGKPQSDIAAKDAPANGGEEATFEVNE